MYITAHNYFLRRTIFIHYNLNGDIKIITKLGRDMFIKDLMKAQYFIQILTLPGFIISDFLHMLCTY